MTVTRFESSQAKNNWGKLLDAARTSGTDVVITRQNEPLVAMVAYEDYLAVQQALADYRAERHAQRLSTESFATLIASEKVLAREWDTPEEDEAWADL